MKKIFFYLMLTGAIISTSCKKNAGLGGQASIKGKVLERKMNITFALFYGQYPAADFNVYIIYGSDATYGNSMKSGTDGTYEFKYLEKGDYKIYVYSNDSLATVTPPFISNPPKIAIFKSCRITSRKQVVDVEPIVIYN